MSHALSSHFGNGHFDAATVANNSFVLDLLVFSASAFPIARRTEDLFAKQSAILRLERALVDRFWFFNFPARPFIADHIVGSNFNGQLIKLGILKLFF